MRNQSRYDVKERLLNDKEKQILQEVEQKSGLKIPVGAVQYERHTPRATICTAFFEYPVFGKVNKSQITGVTFRSKKDKENPITGQEWSFRRTLEDYVEREQHNERRK